MNLDQEIALFKMFSSHLQEPLNFLRNEHGLDFRGQAGSSKMANCSVIASKVVTGVISQAQKKFLKRAKQPNTFSIAAV